MAVRDQLPESIQFAVELRLSTVRQYRVSVLLDIQDRWLIFPVGILHDVRDRLDEFITQMGAIASNRWAYEQWDAGSDLRTSYQRIHVYAFYQTDYEHLKFNISLEDEGHEIRVEELNLDAIIRL